MGKYSFFSEADTSTHLIEIDSLNDNWFQTKGISGYGFWFPAAPFSGVINDCEITVDAYEDVEREDLPGSEGEPRYYYESMSGYGEYYRENDDEKVG